MKVKIPPGMIVPYETQQIINEATETIRSAKHDSIEDFRSVMLQYNSKEFETDTELKLFKIFVKICDKVLTYGHLIPGLNTLLKELINTAYKDMDEPNRLAAQLMFPKLVTRKT